MKNNYFKNKGVKAWAITTACVLTLGVAVPVTALNPALKDVISIVLGGDRAVVSETEKRYTANAKTRAEAVENGNKKTIEICEEGSVLLKNEARDSQKKALPLNERSKISVFGKNANDVVRSGSGSSGFGSVETKSIYDSLDPYFDVNPTLKSFYADNSASGEGRSSNPAIENGGNIDIYSGETPQEKYTAAVKSSYSSYSDAAVVVISRINGENFDLPYALKRDSSKHYLELDNDEIALLNAVCAANFGHVILVINSASPMELGFLKNPSDPNYHAEIDAALWVGYGGAQGIMALGEILSGKVNPSGHLVDTYAADFTASPVYQNFGNNGVEDGDNYANTLYYFVDYEESIYMGYRYYETRGRNNESWYNANVVYPFGYGLSYTTFSWEFEGATPSTINPESEFEVKVKVTNTGSVAGKEVVQLYADAPYTAGGIEKSATVLAGFEKTGVIAPGQSETVTITVNPYYFASYDYQDKNNNNFKGYELESGNYAIRIAKNVHDTVLNFTMNLSSTYKYENDPTTKNKVENRFEDADDHLGSVLSRNDWEGTFPQSPTDADKVLSTETKNKLKSTDSGNPLQSADASTAQMPVENQKTTLDLSQMNNVDYNDAKWDTLLNATSASDCLNMIDVGAFHSKAITSIGKPKTNEADGPAGFTNFMGDPAFPSGQTCFYCSEVVVASTWNVDLAYDEGICVGEEGIFGDTEGATKMTYSGWYAPGVNLHRSPFAGRTAEYYSEDPVLSGKMAANIVKGCKDRGVYAYVKHFALNEQETNRDANGDITWCTEQAMRELYFKPFEIAVKEGGATAIMSSFNRIGTKWTGGDYRLLTQVLREEWGFQGSVITDFNVKNYMNLKQMIYAGGDLNLASQPKSSQVDLNNANDVKMVRRAAKNVLYTVANSNSFNVVVTGYKTAYWIIIMWCIEAALFTGLTTWGVFAFLKAKKKFEKEAK